MVFKVHFDQVLGRLAQDLADFAVTAKVLLHDVPPVEVWGHIPALDDGAVGDRHATQALRALPAPHGGCDPEVRGRGIC